MLLLFVAGGAGSSIFSCNHLTNPLLPAACILATFAVFARFRRRFRRLARATVALSHTRNESRRIRAQRARARVAQRSRFRAAAIRARRDRRRVSRGARDALVCRRRSPRRRAGASCSWSSSRSRTRPPRRSARRSPAASASVPVVREEIAALADRPDDLPASRRRRARAHRVDRMPRVVERGTQQVVHRRVDDREVLRRRRASGTRTRVSSTPASPTRTPSGLEQQRSCAPRERAPAHHRARTRRQSHRLLVAVADAEPAAQVDVRERDAVGARARRPGRAPCAPPRDTARAR